MNNTLIDNSENLKMSTVLKAFLQDNCFTELMIATGFWDIPGMTLIKDELKSFLERDGTKIRLLIGKDPYVRIYQLEHPEVENKDFPREYLIRHLKDLSVKQEYKDAVNLLLQYCQGDEGKEKFEIRTYGQGISDDTAFLHAKCYIFLGNEIEFGIKETKAWGIIGSSNFTAKGLEDNIELNYLETSNKIVAVQKLVAEDAYTKGHVIWFNEKWEASQPWNEIFLEEILKKSPIGKKVEEERKKKNNIVRPYDVYIKCLQHLWGDIADGRATSMLEAFLPDSIQKLQYQFDAVNQGYSIMKKHNGFILADVVGLGKTVVGILVIKRFIEDPDINGRERNVLIVTPPAIKKSWEETIALFDEGHDNSIASHITFITTGSIGKLLDQTIDDSDFNDSDDEGDLDTAQIGAKKYGLILIDESHKFRNSDTQMYQSMDSLIGSTIPNPYVILLSATPQNNSPKDLKNQIFLFQREHQNTTLETIPGRKLDSYFSAQEKKFQSIKKTKPIDNNELIKLSKDIREKVLDLLVVRRTRTDIKTYYADDAKDLKFPAIAGPHILEYKMDDELAKLFSDTMDIIAPYDAVHGEFIFCKEGLNYYRYRAIEHLTDKANRALYQKRNLTVEGTSQRLARIMQILLVKRLESSFSAFKTSLHNLERYTQNMIDMINDDNVFICPDVDVNAELNTKAKNRSKEECYAAIRQKAKDKGGNNREFHSTDLSADYLEGLQNDMAIIKDLRERWDETTYDPKLRKFIHALDSELFSKEINNPHGYDPQKLVIFSEAIDTVNELRREINGQGDHKVLAITAANRDEMRETIKANFDANAKEKKDEYDVLITTEVLAEGVNLHRSNVILNYDTPWNSTRLMQRIGRVNRIGSKEDFVNVFNFMPSEQGNAQIGLIEKAHTKLQAFHAMFGEDSKIFSQMEVVVNYGQDPEALRKLLDGDESVFEKYIAELKQLKQQNPGEYERIASLPDGLASAKKSGNDETVCVVRTHGGNGLYLLAKGDGDVDDIPTIELVEKLQCSPDTEGLPLPQELSSIQEHSLATYKQFFDRMKTAHDSKGIITTAKGHIQEWLKKTTDDDTKFLLKIADKCLRNGDMSLAKLIVGLYQRMNDTSALFTADENDLNDLLKNTFKDLKKRYDSDLHNLEPYVYLSLTNYTNDSVKKG